MKKLLLFFIAVFAVIACIGQNLDGIAEETFGVEDYSVYEDEDGKMLGETVVIENCQLTEKEILYKLAAVYHFEREIDGIRIIYGYSPRLKHVKLVENKPVNFQITFSGDTVTVSNPVNYGSF